MPVGLGLHFVFSQLLLNPWRVMYIVSNMSPVASGQRHTLDRKLRMLGTLEKMKLTSSVASFGRITCYSRRARRSVPALVANPEPQRALALTGTITWPTSTWVS